MSIHPHGGHSWMQMGLGDYKWGLVCENEARSAADGHCESWVHARIGTKDKKKRFGEEGQGRLVESRVRTGDML